MARPQRGTGQDGASNDGTGVDANRAIVGLLALAVADREERLVRGDSSRPDSKFPARRSEAVLADAGLSTTEIARVTGKDYAVVQGLVRRDREAREARKKSSRVTAATPQEGA